MYSCLLQKSSRFNSKSLCGKPNFGAIAFEKSISGEPGNPIVSSVTLNPKILHSCASKLLSIPPEKATAKEDSSLTASVKAPTNAFFNSTGDKLKSSSHY